jgi:hypothetical protein
MKALNPNQRYFQIQTKFKPSPKTKFGTFETKGFLNSNQNLNQEDSRNKAFKTSFQIIVSIQS